MILEVQVLDFLKHHMIFRVSGRKFFVFLRGFIV